MLFTLVLLVHFSEAAGDWYDLLELPVLHAGPAHISGDFNEP